MLALPEGVEDFVLYCDASISRKGHGANAEGARDSIYVETAEASREEISHPRSRVSGDGVRPKDLASLSVRSSVHHIYGPQKLEVSHRLALPKHETKEMVRCDERL